MPARKSLLLCALLLVACDRRDDHSMTPLMYAAQRGDTVEIKRLLKRGADIEAAVKPHNDFRVLLALIAWMQELPDRKVGYTALMFAVDKSHYDAARVLLDHGANPSVDAHGLTPLDVAIFKTDMDMVRLLVERGAKANPKRGAEPLIFAAARNDTSLLRILLKLGTPVNVANQGQITPLMAAAEAGAAEAVDMLLAAGADPRIQGRNGWRAARYALARGHNDIADKLGAGEDRLNAALFAAIAAGDVAATFDVLERGADINALSEKGRSALMEATDRLPEDAIFRLMDRGARMREDEKVPMLFLSVVFGYEKLFDRMLKEGAQPRSDFVPTAVRSNQVAMLKKLLAMGLDPRTQDVMQHTPLELARLLKRDEMIPILEAAEKERP